MYRVCVAPHVNAVWSIRAYVPCLTFYIFTSASVTSSASKPYYNLYGGETGELYLRAQIRCAMYGIEFKVYTSFVHERSSCPCVACTCGYNKGAFMYMRHSIM